MEIAVTMDVAVRVDSGAAPADSVAADAAGPAAAVVVAEAPAELQ